VKKSRVTVREVRILKPLIIKFMTPQKWLDIVSQIKDKFKIEEQKSRQLDDEGGITIEEVIFQGPLGRMRLEFITKPVVLDKKTTYSKRIGSSTKVDYVYSQQEKNYKLKAYRWDEVDQDWLEIEAKNFNL